MPLVSLVENIQLYKSIAPSWAFIDVIWREVKLANYLANCLANCLATALQTALQTAVQLPCSFVCMWMHSHTYNYRIAT